MASPLLSTFSLSDNIIGFIIDGPYDEQVVKKIENSISKKLEIFDRVNFYIEDTLTAKPSTVAILKSLVYKYRTRKRFEKVAIVTDRKWLHIFCKMEKLFLGVDMRIYLTKDRLKAIQWITY